MPWCKVGGWGGVLGSRPKPWCPVPSAQCLVPAGARHWALAAITVAEAERPQPRAAALQRLQVLHQVVLLLLRQPQGEHAVVVRDHVGERPRAAVVEVGGVLPEPAERRGAI